MNGRFSEEDANKLLQIGLTCIQADAELRPSMPLVVKMINGEHEISCPTQPPFLNTSSSILEAPPEQPGAYFFQPDSHTQSTGNEISESFIVPR